MTAAGSDEGRRLPMFPLGTVLFPGGILPLRVFEPRYRRMMTDCLDGERAFGVVLISRGSEVGGGDQRVSVGTEARIERAAALPDGRWTVVVSGVHRIGVDRWLPEDPYPEAVVRPMPGHTEDPSEGPLADAARAVRRAMALLSELGRGTAPGDPLSAGPSLESAALAWRLCDVAPLGPLDRQRLLEIDQADERLATLTDLTEQVSDDLHRILAGGGAEPGHD